MYLIRHADGMHFWFRQADGDWRTDGLWIMSEASIFTHDEACEVIDFHPGSEMVKVA